MNHTTGKKSFAQVREDLKARVQETRDFEEREGVETFEDEKDVDMVDYEPSRVDLFGACFTKEGNTSNSLVAEKLQKMTELASKLPPGAKDSGPNDIFSQIDGSEKGGIVKIFGFGICASDVYDGLMPSRLACNRINEELKEENAIWKKRSDEQNRQIEEQNKQIQELLKMSKQRFENMESPPQVTTVPSSSCQVSTHRQSSASSTKITSLRAGTKVRLKSLDNPSNVVAIGRIDFTDPLELIGSVELGKNMYGVRVNVGVQMNEELIRPIYEFKSIGESIEKTIAWPRALVIEYED